MRLDCMPGYLDGVYGVNADSQVEVIVMDDRIVAHGPWIDRPRILLTAYQNGERSSSQEWGGLLDYFLIPHGGSLGVTVANIGDKP